MGQGNEMNGDRKGGSREAVKEFLLRSAPWVSVVAFAFSVHVANAAEASLRVCADPNDLPYSNQLGEGFENKIAALIAEKLGMPLQFVWRAQRRGFLREGLNAGECDLVTGIPVASQGVLSTRAYYRSTYVFVSRPSEPRVSSLDDPSLRTRKIGVQLIGDDGMNTPPAHALAKRGIVINVRGFPVYGDYAKDSPGSDIVTAVASGQIDVAAVWGPIGGYFADGQHPQLIVTPMEPDLTDQTPLTFDMAMGVRKKDSGLASAVQRALDESEPQIASILASFKIPVVVAADK
jgi:mxaJ protein